MTGLPAWSLGPGDHVPRAPGADWPAVPDRAWAFGDGRAAGVRVAVIDSGIDPEHPVLGGPLQRAVAVEAGGAAGVTVVADETGDVSGHGTACAGIIRALAPACELTSVRVLGPDLTGGGEALVAGLRWAIAEGHQVVNLSLSTTKTRFAEALRALVDQAYFRGAIVVASAHNMPVDSWPWRFAPVLSVGSHALPDAEAFLSNPNPPVEFHARGLDVEVGWAGGTTIRASGNSFAAPHMAAMAARVLGAHPALRAFEVKTVLHLIATNTEGAR